ncbi:MAG TPA: hypothetical protein PLD37_01815 [Usitatibacteraceae bacterium]|nr:hypothetical protein [Usitatibacteraceae bacterium]
MNSTFHQNTDSVTKIAGAIFIVISGVYALCQYRYAQEREFQKAFYDKQLDVVMEVFDTLTEIDSATAPQERKAAVNKFWAIYHGKARTFLDPKMFKNLDYPAEYVSGCVMKVKPTKTIDCSNFSSSMATPGFAIVAREQLSRAWARSLSDLAKEDPWSEPSQ